jgi:hypothetical protein
MYLDYFSFCDAWQEKITSDIFDKIITEKDKIEQEKRSEIIERLKKDKNDKNK